MKHISTIFRTLCLAALLCITSVNASAYKVYDSAYGKLDNSFLSKNYMGDNKILVIKDSHNHSVNGSLNIPKDCAVIIESESAVSITSQTIVFYNMGSLYIFGSLYISSLADRTYMNMSNIYTDGNGKIDNVDKLTNFGTIDNSIPYSARKITDGSFPVTTNSGWNNYWEKGIACGDDFYPMGGYFEDEACTKPIANLAVWKNGGGRNVDLGLKIGGTGGYDNWEYYDTDEKKGFYYNGDLALEGYQDFEANDNFNVTGTFTYTRNLSSAIGKWQSWYEPFEVELTADVLAKMDAAQIAGILTDADGNTVVAFRKMKASETMKANTPYVIRMKDTSGMLMLNFENGKTIFKSEENTYQFSSMFDDFKIGGIYTARNNSDWYALSAAGAFSKLNSTALQAQRLWLTMTPRTDSPYYNPTVSSKGFIGMTVLGDDETTGIAGAAESGIRSGVIFNLKGERVTSIRRGQVYIVDGKRFMAR